MIRFTRQMWRWARAGLMAGAMGLGAAAHADQVPAMTVEEISPMWEVSCNCYRNVPWGPDSWFETSLNRMASQVYDLWMPTVPTSGPIPVVIWAHASGGEHTIPTKGTLATGLVKPALAAGMAVLSVEYRHPVDNAYLGDVYHDDLVHAVQYARAVAPLLGLDPQNFFFASRSRGTLALWSALQDDRANPDGDLVQQQSSRVNAVFAIQAQTTYRSEENALYLYEEERRAYMRTRPVDPRMGSAVASASADDPPVLIRYEEPFFRRLVHRQELKSHHPDYGLTLCQAYTDLGIGDRCTAQELVPTKSLFDGLIPFFQANLKPPPTP